MFRNYCYVLMETERINCYWLMSRRSLRKRNTKQLKILGKRFFKRLSYLHHFTIPVLQQPANQKVFFCLYSVFWQQCWHECKGNVKLPFLKSHIKRLNTDNEKTSFAYSEQRSMPERKEKVHLSVLLIRPPVWMFRAGENKQLKAASVIQDT